MDHSTIRHLKLQAKRLKQNSQTLTYCQCLNLVAQKNNGSRNFHELQRTFQQVSSNLSTHETNLSSPNDFRCNDWPYFDLPKLSEKNLTK